jgi:predicted dehydrogenase
MAREKSQRLRALVVGAGSGGRLSIGAVVDDTAYELVGIADRFAEAADAAAADLAAGTPTFTDVGQALDELQPDVVCVSTWAPSHREITERALAVGVRGLVVEKPLAGTVTDARAVLDTIVDQQVPVVVPHGLMSMPAPLHLLDEVRSGTLGRIRAVQIDCTGWDLINAGIHWLQFAVACLGDDRVTTVECTADVSTRTYRDGFMVETEAVTSARTAGGVRLEVRTGDDLEVASPTGTRIAFVGDQGSAVYHPWEHEYRIDRRTGETVVTRPPGHLPTGHRFYLRQLREQIAAGITDYSIPRQSLQALEIIRAAYLAAREGGAVTLPLHRDDLPIVSDDRWFPGEVHDPARGGRDGRALPPPRHPAPKGST